MPLGPVFYNVSQLRNWCDFAHYLVQKSHQLLIYLWILKNCQFTPAFLSMQTFSSLISRLSPCATLVLFVLQLILIQSVDNEFLRADQLRYNRQKKFNFKCGRYKFAKVEIEKEKEVVVEAGETRERRWVVVVANIFTLFEDTEVEFYKFMRSETNCYSCLETLTSRWRRGVLHVNKTLGLLFEIPTRHFCFKINLIKVNRRYDRLFSFKSFWLRYWKSLTAAIFYRWQYL